MKLSFLGSKSWCFQIFITLKTRCKKDPCQRHNLPKLIKKDRVIFVNNVYILCCGCHMRKVILFICISCKTLLSWALDSVCYTSVPCSQPLTCTNTNLYPTAYPWRIKKVSIGSSLYNRRIIKHQVHICCLLLFFFSQRKCVSSFIETVLCLSPKLQIIVKKGFIF